MLSRKAQASAIQTALSIPVFMLFTQDTSQCTSLRTFRGIGVRKDIRRYSHAETPAHSSVRRLRRGLLNQFQGCNSTTVLSNTDRGWVPSIQKSDSTGPGQFSDLVLFSHLWYELRTLSYASEAFTCNEDVARGRDRCCVLVNS